MCDEVRKFTTVKCTERQKIKQKFEMGLNFFLLKIQLENIFRGFPVI
jgi:hypothetical protein